MIFTEGLCKVAEQYLKKGGKVYIEGKLQTRKWTDQTAWKSTRPKSCCRVSTALTMLEGRSGGGGGSFGPTMPAGISAPGPAARAAAGGGGRGGRSSDMDDDIPF